MSENEKDPPLAGKAKLSSLTDFEIKALMLQKEGKLEELKKAIEEVSPTKPETAVPKPVVEDTASEQDMAVYNDLVQRLKNPVSLDKVPAKQRRQIEEGMAFLREIVSDKDKLEGLRKQHQDAFKKSEEKLNPLKPPVLPDHLKTNEPEPVKKEEPAKKEEPVITSGDVSTKPEAAKPVYKENNLSFINDISSPSAEASRPQTYKEEPSPHVEYTAPSKEYQPSAISLMPNCPHCGWDLKREDLIGVTPEDKFDFVQSILGSIRFKKSYEMFDGKYKVVFKAITTKEADIAYRQIVIDGQLDYNSRIIGGTDFYWRNLQAYRMVMSLDSIESVDYGRVSVPSLEEAEIEMPDSGPIKLQNKLVPFLNHVLDNYLPLESTRAIIGHAYFEFQSLCDKLQVMAESPTFWKAIE